MKEKFIPRTKLGTRARKQLDAAKRRTWECSPVARVMENRKAYNRKRTDPRGRDDEAAAFFIVQKTAGAAKAVRRGVGVPMPDGFCVNGVKAA